MRFRNTTYKLSKGKLYLIPCFEFHDYHCPDSMDHYFVHFTSRLSMGTDLFSVQNFQYCVDASQREYDLFARLVEINPEKKLLDLNPNKRLTGDKDGRETDGADESSINPGEELSSVVESNGILMQLLSPILKTAKDLSQDEKLYAIGRLEHVLRYVDENLEDDIELSDLAKVAHLNPTYFSNMFSRLMGIRPTDYLNKKRIEKSQMLLLCSGKKLKEIALDVGFADPNYFSRVFKKYTGLSPQEYIHTVANGPAKIK